MNHEAIAKIYADLVKAGRRTIEEVPQIVRSLVEQLLETE